MSAFLNDGSAVAACRALLQDKGIPGSWNWRNTVVTRDGPEYVVRIWVNVPAGQARPEGTPDYVYVAAPTAGKDGGFSIEQVHPDA
jgi:hypothetical protein